jgi:hypothetical protein
VNLFDELYMRVVTMTREAHLAGQPRLLPALIVLSPYGWAKLRSDWRVAIHPIPGPGVRRFCGVVMIEDLKAAVDWTIMRQEWAWSHIARSQVTAEEADAIKNLIMATLAEASAG